MKRHGEADGDTEQVWSPAEAFTLASSRFLAELRKELLNTLNAVPERGDHRVSVGPARRVTTSGNTLKGWSLHETTGAATALVYLRDGTDNTGDIIAVVSLVAGGEKTTMLSDRGITIAYGLYLDVASGAIEGAVYLGAS